MKAWPSVFMKEFSMLNKERLLELVRNGENSFVEFKDEAVANEKLAREIAAFANHRGGYIFVGVNDDGKITGIARSDNEERIMNLCADLISPPLALSYYELTVDVKRVGVIEIEAGHNKPYAVKETVSIDGKKKKIQTYFLRYGSTSREINARDELQRLFQASGNIHYEIVPVAGARMSDLDLAAFAEFMLNFRNLDLSQFDESSLHRLLENLNLAIPTESILQPTIAGLLLFGKNKVTRWLPQNGIDCVKIHGNDLSDEIDDTKFFERHVFANLEDAIAFIHRYNTHSFVVEGMRRVDSFDYPEKALRECLVNAIVHRDYIIAGSRMRVHIFENRIEIRSPGGIPNSLSLDKIKLGLTYHRNPVLMQFFYEARLSERLGRGIPSIFQQMKENGNPEPVLEDLEEEFRITLYKKLVT
jgi:ATP-dependent DNA helicase RecG